MSTSLNRFLSDPLSGLDMLGQTKYEPFEHSEFGQDFPALLRIQERPR